MKEAPVGPYQPVGKVLDCFLLLVENSSYRICPYYCKEPPGPARGSTACDKIYFPCPSWKSGQEKGKMMIVRY